MENNKLKELLSEMDELSQENIISEEQCKIAKEYFVNNKVKKQGTSITTIFTAIGILLVALSIITIFAFNWDNISKGIKVILVFIPLIISAVMLAITMKKDSNKWRIYTSIFSPIAIIASISLICQIFHIQGEIYEMMFLCLMMFLPIAAILRNKISILFYGLGAIIYIGSSCHMPEYLLSSIISALPIIIYNIYNYIKNKDDSSNIIMWLINGTIISILLFFGRLQEGISITEGLLRPDIILIYSYMMYLITRKLFDSKGILVSIFKIVFVLTLLLFSTVKEIVSFATSIDFSVDTLILSAITIALVYDLKIYKDIKEMIILIALVLLQYTALKSDVLFVLINMLSLTLGVYYIVKGNKAKSYKTSMGGVAIILFLIYLRFTNSDLDFIQKSIMFLITGGAFIVTANVMKKKLGGN